MAQLVKNSPATQETLVQFPGREDPLEKGVANHSRLCRVLVAHAGSFDAACELSSCGTLPPEPIGSVLAVFRLSHPEACGILFP